MKLYEKKSFTKDAYYISTKYDIKTIKSFQSILKKINELNDIKDIKTLSLEVEYDEENSSVKTFIYKKNTDVRLLLSNENYKNWNIIAFVGTYKKKDLYIKFYKKGFHKEFDKLGIKVGIFLTGEKNKNDVEELNIYIEELEKILY